MKKLTTIYLLILFTACSSTTGVDTKYPYIETINFEPYSSLIDKRLHINGNRGTIKFDIPEITPQIVASGSVELRINDDGRLKDLPIKVRYTFRGNPYYEGYIYYYYSRGTLSIVTVTTSDDVLVKSDINGGPYELIVRNQKL
jgi:hypothetical protein